MKNYFLKLTLVFVILLIGCSEDDNTLQDITSQGNTSEGTETSETSNVNLEEALLRKFPLTELNLGGDFEIDISHPTLRNGVPVDKGTIKIQISANTATTTFSLKEVEFDKSKFTISPAVGDAKIKLNETITYSITSIDKPSLSMQYDILVTLLSVDPTDENLSLMNFSFLKSDNDQLTEDILSAEIRDHDRSQPHDYSVIMIVPNGTNFSNLVPTINYKGSKIKYHTVATGNSSDFKPYTKGTSLDFKYPNIITFRIYNSDESKFIEFKVLVDVKNPIIFDKESVLLNEGEFVSRFQVFENVIRFTLVGNYPITSKIVSNNIVVTETPETTPRNYYNVIDLRKNGGSGNTIRTGERGSLFIQLNFPGTFTGSFSGLAEYKVEVEFAPVLVAQRTARIGAKQSEELPDRDDHFEIYDAKKIEIKANVLVTNEN